MALRKLSDEPIHKLRVVDVEEDRTVISEPSKSEWTVADRGVRVIFWNTAKWNALPPQMRPANAQRQGDDGFLVLSPA